MNKPQKIGIKSRVIEFMSRAVGNRNKVTIDYKSTYAEEFFFLEKCVSFLRLEDRIWSVCVSENLRKIGTKLLINLPINRRSRIQVLSEKLKTRNSVAFGQIPRQNVVTKVAINFGNSSKLNEIPTTDSIAFKENSTRYSGHVTLSSPDIGRDIAN